MNGRAAAALLCAFAALTSGCASVSPMAQFIPGVRPVMPVVESPELFRHQQPMSFRTAPELLPPRAVAGQPTLDDLPRGLSSRIRDALGAVYRRGGSSLRSGFDCSGLVRFLMAGLSSVPLPRSSRDMSRVPAPSVPREQLAPGDLVFFDVYGRGVSHTGVYLGDGRFVHAAYRANEVRIDRLDDRYWSRRYAGAKRVVDARLADAAPASTQSSS